MQQIIRQLFQADSLDDVPKERLEKMVREYPSFGMAHYLLSRKLASAGDEGFAEESRRTSLYFTNPLWLQWQLKNAASLPAEKEDIPQSPEGEISKVAEIAPVLHQEPIRDEEAPFVLDEPEENPETKRTPAGPETPNVQEADLVQPEMSAADRLMENIGKAQALRQTLHRIHEGFEAGQPEAGEQRQEPQHAPDYRQEQPEARELRQEAEEAREQRQEQAKAPEYRQEQAEAPELRQERPETREDRQEQADAPEQDQIEPQPSMPGPEKISGAETPIFEPYHTIDYFASQGIRLTLEDNPPDKLGKQLKSFTEWLKVMRKLPPKDKELAPDPAVDQNIQTIAAHSIEGREILTETMAEVLVKQGRPDKAAEMYRKLSLLNPDKSSYFAAKIEHLNTQ